MQEANLLLFSFFWKSKSISCSTPVNHPSSPHQSASLHTSSLSHLLLAANFVIRYSFHDGRYCVNMRPANKATKRTLQAALLLNLFCNYIFHDLLCEKFQDLLDVLIALDDMLTSYANTSSIWIKACQILGLRHHWRWHPGGSEKSKGNSRL